MVIKKSYIWVFAILGLSLFAQNEEGWFDVEKARKKMADDLAACKNRFSKENIGLYDYERSVKKNLLETPKPEYNISTFDDLCLYFNYGHLEALAKAMKKVYDSRIPGISTQMADCFTGESSRAGCEELRQAWKTARAYRPSAFF